MHACMPVNICMQAFWALLLSLAALLAYQTACLARARCGMAHPHHLHASPSPKDSYLTAYQPDAESRPLSRLLTLRDDTLTPHLADDLTPHEEEAVRS